MLFINGHGVAPLIMFRDPRTGDEFVRLKDVITVKTQTISIKMVIFSPPATIVLWSDGTKTVVKAENEPFDKEKGLAMAICKRTSGNKGAYFEVFKKWCRDRQEPPEASTQGATKCE